MSKILNKPTVLVLNRNWQAIHVKTPAEAFCMMATGVATALDIRGDDHILPASWEAWLKLPVREQDHAIYTPRGSVRAPTVIVAANYAKIPLRQPRFGARGIWERDGASSIGVDHAASIGRRDAIRLRRSGGTTRRTRGP